MIRFVDINTGNTFNGDAITTNPQDSPYCHWFDNEQSIDLIHNKSICFVYDKSSCNVKLPINNIFKLLDPKKIEEQSRSLDDVLDINKLYAEEIDSKWQYVNLKGTRYRNVYVYIIYISASSPLEGEFIEKFYIDDNMYLVGADFYNLNESLYINLSNNGVRIPTTISKAFYDTNVHEDKADHILLNRKFKELLSNYWDILANKGSYKSLYNSLNWFEYGDKLKLYELWKQFDNGGREYYHTKNINELVDKYQSDTPYLKTTYIALDLISNELDKNDNGEVLYDDQTNPILNNISYKWAKNDLILKMFLVGEFYKTYFIPIHISLLFSAVSDLIFSDTIKVFNGGLINRNDIIIPQKLECNIKHNQIFSLTEVETYFDQNVLFSTNILNNQTDIVGVTTNIPDNVVDLTNYVGQLYKGVGVVVDFSLSIPLKDGDQIKKSVLYLRIPEGEDYKWIKRENYKDLTNNVKFQILCQNEGKYKASMQFDTYCGEVFTKNIDFEVVDDRNITLQLYKLKPNESLINLENLRNNSSINNFINSRQILKNSPIYHQNVLTSNNSGIKYNKMIVLNLIKNGDKWKLNESLKNSIQPTNDIVNGLEGLINNSLKGLENYYICFESNNTTICIGKIFGDIDFKINSEYIYKNINKVNIIKNENYIFCPEFHELANFPENKNDIKSYIINNDEVLCVKPNLNISKLTQNPEWEFINVSNNEAIKLPGSVKEPFILPMDNPTLSNGYYNILFRYKLGNVEKEIQLNSAFIKR